MISIKSKLVTRGDTIVEVVFAFAVFSLVAVGALAIINKGAAIAQRALEITLVRDQINGQAEALRYLHDAYVASYDRNVSITIDKDGSLAQKWHFITQYTTDTTQANTECSFASTTFNKAFVINPQELTVITNTDKPPKSPEIYARINGNNAPEGLWVQAVGGSSGGISFTDFHIRACWFSIGQLVPVTIGTIVRLYEPN
jgi:type II secretory pathway pseudopilin PulG